MSDENDTAQHLALAGGELGGNVVMNSGAPEPLATWSVLHSLGFTPDAEVISDSPGGLSYDFGNLTLSASHQTNRWFQPIVMLSGVMATARTMAMIQCEMPALLESREQGAAWVAWCLDRKATAKPFTPEFATPWLAEGRRHRHLLPWERERAAFAARPHCLVEREWAKVALRKLAEALLAQEDGAEALHLSFDGEVLKLRLGGALMAVPAIGTPWPSAFAIPAEALRRLPQRLSRGRVEVGVWAGSLTIGNRLYRGIVPSEPRRV